VVEPLTPTALAVIVVVPWAAVTATPEFVASPLIGATFGAEEFQRADCKLSVLLSLNVPTAVKRCCAPAPIEGAAGVIAILVSPFSRLDV
jgi:trimethylamine:corrinoid methyltransferase-like protein